MAKVYGRSGSIGHGGKQYAPGDDGSFDVPPELATILLAQGFSTQPLDHKDEPPSARIAQLEGDLLAATVNLDQARARIAELEGLLERATQPELPGTDDAPASSRRKRG